mmetsp:Transcript_69246/g.129278  ORF Transcript_69246/g.129278 Transcript_69246/m.129278 type:complete len:235 (+) Transcript_69246:89-793(+)
MTSREKRGGLLPRAHLPDGVTAEVIQRMYFSTSTRDATQDHYRTRPDDVRNARGPSMKNLLNVNGNTGTGPRPRLAGSTSYSSEYFQKPLDDLDTNRALSRLFAEKAKGPKLISDARPPLETDTSHKDAFPVRPIDLDAVGKKSPMSLQVHIDPTAKMLESQTVMQRSFPKLAAEDRIRARPERALPPPGEAKLTGSNLEAKSMYKREFSASRLKFVPRKGAAPPPEAFYRVAK